MRHRASSCFLRFRSIRISGSGVVVFTAILHGIGSDIQRPIATVMVWGIFSSALLTLILLPVFYSLIEERDRK